MITTKWQMSVAEGGGVGVGTQVSCPGIGRYHEVQCIMGNGHMGTPFPCEQTELAPFPN